MFPARVQSQRTSPLPSVRLAGLAAVLLVCLAVPAIAGAAVTGASTGISAKTASELKQETGYAASQLESKPVCGAPKPGTMSCEAEILAVKSTGQPVKLLQAPAATKSTVTRSVSRTREIRPSSSTTGVTAPSAYSPAFLQWAYDLTWLSSNRGSGDTIAIVDAYDDPDADPDLAVFRQTYGLWPCTETTSDDACEQTINADGIFQQYNQSGQKIDQIGDTGTAPATDTDGWDIEESLDVDAVSSLCPECTIDLVESSPGPCDSFQGVCQYPDFDSNLAIAAASAEALGANQISMSFGGDDHPGDDDGTWWFNGVTSLAAAGDGGYSDGLSGNYVSYPSAASEVTAVGGTSLSTADNARGFTESVWNDGYEPSADSYYATGSGCDTSQQIPSYQASITTDCQGRGYNDISADGDPDTGLSIYDSEDSGDCVDSDDQDWCVVGGTSLATPLTAAYEALTGVTPADTPAWAYLDQPYLNDIASGNDVDAGAGAPCPSTETLVCYASLNWDGPTGNGSVSGDVIIGAPGIGGEYSTSVGSTSADLAGGVYPNGSDTEYYWQYGTSMAYGSSTQEQDAGASRSPNPVPVVLDLTGLTTGTTYHYRLVATNADGTAYGYDATFTPGSSSGGGDTGTTTTSTPTGKTTTGTTTTGGPTGTMTGGGSPTTGSGPTTTTPNSGGGSAGSSSGELANADPAEIASPRVSSLPIVGGKISVIGGRFANAVSETVQLYRCAHGCVLLNTAGSSSYRLRAADAGHYIKLKLTVDGQPGTTPLVATDWIGPIRATGAGAADLSGETRVGSTLGVYGTSNLKLASVQVTRRSGGNLTLAITKPGSAATQVWAYVVSGGSVVSCTPAHAVRGHLKLNFALSSGESLKLVALRS